ncbi:MAG: glycosyltransferase [Candidatus Levybacteria bacterium]|nr:glycosyltransferase [Candidatus Levybacteria bacterium]
MFKFLPFRKLRPRAAIAAKQSIFTPIEKVAYIALVILALFFLYRYFSWWIRIDHLPSNWANSPLHTLDIFLFILLSFVVFIGPVVRLGGWFALLFASKPKFIKSEKGLKVAFLTCYVPGKEPVDLLVKTLRTMKAVRYPHDTWVLDEGNSQEVRRICRKLGVIHFSRCGIEKYNQKEGIYRARTKAGNHNAWRNKHDHKYDIVAQIDMDHVPEPEFFERTLGYFKDPKVGIVGMPQVYKNTENWIARGAAEQAYFFHGPMQQGFYGSDMPFLIGTSHLYRVSAMNNIGGYGPTIVEDHLTGMNFYARGWKGVFVPEVLARGEGPLNWVDYFNQQKRWSYGLFEIFFKHTPKILPKLALRHKINYFFAQLFYFTGVAVAVGSFLTVIYLIFGINSANMDLRQWVKYAFPPFIMANIIQIYGHRFNIDSKREPVFGLLGMFLGLAANLVYTIAFVRFISGQKLKYMVTQKGSTGQKQLVPLSAFNVHLAFVLVLLLSFVASLFNNHSAIQFRFWAIFNVVTLAAVAASIYWDGFQTYIKMNRLMYQTFRYSFTVVSVLIMVTTAGVIYTQWHNIAQAMSPVVKLSDEPPMSGKVNAPQDGVLFGISLYQHNDINALRASQKAVSQQFRVVGFYQSWGVKQNKFNKNFATNIQENGSLPLITWEPWDPISGYDRSEAIVDQKEYRLSNIIEGKFDDYIRQYAQDITAYRKPVMLRFAHEMNGNWYPWGSTFNKPQEYVVAWRHVHEIFDSVGATNVTWVWSPNEIYYEKRVLYSHDIATFYPGDDYVDWVGFSAFNWAGIYKQNVWKTPKMLYSETIAELKKLNKPIMITETASAESSVNSRAKAKWVSEFASYIQKHPEIKGVVWFNTKDNGINWSMTSSENSKAAFLNVFDSEIFSPK